MENKEKQLQGLVRHEAKALRRHATGEERDRLSIEKLVYNSKVACAYGLMTGNCNSNRAIELIQKCASRVIEDDKQVYEMEDKLKSSINGAPIGKNRHTYWSPIEVFIAQKSNRYGNNNKKLIEYIKGETNELNFE